MTLRNDVQLILYRGSDILEALLFKDDTGAPINMTGHSIEIVEAETWFQSGGSVAWTNQVAGEAVLSRPWASNAPETTWVRIRTKRTADDFDDGFPRIVVRFL